MHPCPRYLQAQDFQILMDIFIFEKKRIVSYLFVLLENSTSYRIFSTKMVHFFHFWTKEESQFS